jgi:hypothetical protein
VKTDEAVERMASAEKGVPVARSGTDAGRFSNLQGAGAHRRMKAQTTSLPSQLLKTKQRTISFVFSLDSFYPHAYIQSSEAKLPSDTPN